MSFITSLIAKSSDAVLAEHTDYQGNFQQISRSILQKIVTNTTGILKSGYRKFFFINEDGLTIMCLTEDISNEVAFAFLYDVKKHLFEKYTLEEVLKLNAYGLKALEPELADMMDYFQIQPSMTKSGSLVDDFKSLGVSVQENLNKFLGKELQLVVTSNKETENFNFGTNLNNLVSLISNLFSLMQKRWKITTKVIRESYG